MKFVNVFYDSILLAAEIFQDYVKTGGGQLMDTISFFLRHNDKKRNDAMACSWFQALNSLRFEKDSEKQACVDFFKTCDLELCRQMLNCQFIDYKSNFVTCCQYR